MKKRILFLSLAGVIFTGCTNNSPENILVNNPSSDENSITNSISLKEQVDLHVEQVKLTEEEVEKQLKEKFEGCKEITVEADDVKFIFDEVSISTEEEMEDFTLTSLITAMNMLDFMYESYYNPYNSFRVYIEFNSTIGNLLISYPISLYSDVKGETELELLQSFLERNPTSSSAKSIRDYITRLTK